MALTRKVGEGTRAGSTAVAVLALLAALLVLPLALAPIQGRTGAPTSTAHDQNFRIYWTTQYTIGRAELDGTDIEPSFISGAYGAYTTDVAIDAGHVYWGQSSSTSQGDVYDARIGRADIDGTNVNQIFVSLGEDRPDSLAVDGLTGSRVAGKASATKTQRQSGKKIVVKVTVKAEEKLTAEATGKIKANPTYKLKPQKVRFAAGESKPLQLKPRRAAAKEIAAALKRGKKATGLRASRLTAYPLKAAWERAGLAPKWHHRFDRLRAKRQNQLGSRLSVSRSSARGGRTGGVALWTRSAT